MAVVSHAGAILVLVGVAALGVARGARAQISPGPLAQPHASLEGALQCGSCHAGGQKEQMTTLCLQCHKEIAWLIGQNRGYHARHPGERCATCHPDHAGRGFSLISWPGRDSARFDHGLAGWPLGGSHQKAKCSDCHRTPFRVGAAASLAPGPDASGSPGWTGLEPSCVSCHHDVHRGTLAKDCRTCHDVQHWTPAPRFDHMRTDYPLTGRHGEVPCEGCHRPGPPARDSTQVVRRFTPVPHRDCGACHADPHRGRFTGACGDCHVTTGFTVINRGHFNHDRTRYPLRGRHASVACTNCHDVPGVRGKAPPFARCSDCHTDPHAGTGTLAGAAVDCGSCHSVDGFSVPSFTMPQHRLTKFPLEGAHQRVRCVQCHLKNPPGVPPTQLGRAGILMRPAFERCLTCHRDPHGGQLAGRGDRGECATCHSVASWTPSTFTVADHARTRFTLDGRHAEIDCAACHGVTRSGLPPQPNAAGLGEARVAFHLAGRECVSCHLDPHQGRFARCLACHTTSGYRPSTIDVAAHAAYGFTLEGAHRAVPCVACHTELQHPAVRSSLVLTRWTGAPLLFTMNQQGCRACHTTPHGDQFITRPDGGKCESCHGLDAFAPASRFNHDRDTKFPLRVAHANLACSRCHPTIAGTRTIRYRPVSSRCENCHGDGVRQ